MWDKSVQFVLINLDSVDVFMFLFRLLSLSPTKAVHAPGDEEVIWRGQHVINTHRYSLDLYIFLPLSYFEIRK